MKTVRATGIVLAIVVVTGALGLWAVAPISPEVVARTTAVAQIAAAFGVLVAALAAWRSAKQAHETVQEKRRQTDALQRQLEVLQSQRDDEEKRYREAIKRSIRPELARPEVHSAGWDKPHLEPILLNTGKGDAVDVRLALAYTSSEEVRQWWRGELEQPPLVYAAGRPALIPAHEKRTLSIEVEPQEGKSFTLMAYFTDREYLPYRQGWGLSLRKDHSGNWDVDIERDIPLQEALEAETI